VQAKEDSHLENRFAPMSTTSSATAQIAKLQDQVRTTARDAHARACTWQKLLSSGKRSSMY
jgi:hypothetical protein